MDFRSEELIVVLKSVCFFMLKIIAVILYVEKPFPYLVVLLPANRPSLVKMSFVLETAQSM